MNKTNTAQSAFKCCFEKNLPYLLIRDHCIDKVLSQCYHNNTRFLCLTVFDMGNQFHIFVKITDLCLFELRLFDKR